MQKIKIGRSEYDIKTGDYIMYNGNCYQFCTGDGRVSEMKELTDKIMN